MNKPTRLPPTRSRAHAYTHSLIHKECMLKLVLESRCVCLFNTLRIWRYSFRIFFIQFFFEWLLIVMLVLKLCLCLTFWHRSFTFNSNKSPTWCNNFSVYYPDVCLQLNMLRAFSRLSSGAQWLQWHPLVLPSYRGDSRAVFVVGPAGRPAYTCTCLEQYLLILRRSNCINLLSPEFYI
jgi:hypothetical protein